MSTSEAWLIEYDDSLSIALGDHAMVELVQGSSIFPIPGAPKHCSSVCLWHSKILPIMDIRSILNIEESAQDDSGYLCIIRYRFSQDKPVQQFALRVNKAPQRITVDDSQACDVPENYQSSLLDDAIISCFSHNEKPVLILDINRLCSADFLSHATAA